MSCEFIFAVVAINEPTFTVDPLRNTIPAGLLSAHRLWPDTTCPPAGRAPPANAGDPSAAIPSAAPVSAVVAWSQVRRDFRTAATDDILLMIAPLSREPQGEPKVF